MAKWKIEYTLNVTRIYDDNDGDNGTNPGIMNPIEWAAATNQWIKQPDYTTEFDLTSVELIEPTNPEHFCSECGCHIKFHDRGTCRRYYGVGKRCPCNVDYTVFCVKCKHEATFHTKDGGCHMYYRRVPKDGQSRNMRCKCRVEEVGKVVKE